MVNGLVTYTWKREKVKTRAVSRALIYPRAIYLELSFSPREQPTYYFTLTILSVCLISRERSSLGSDKRERIRESRKIAFDRRPKLDHVTGASPTRTKPRDYSSRCSFCDVTYLTAQQITLKMIIRGHDIPWLNQTNRVPRG